MWIASWMTIGTGRCPDIPSHGTDRMRDAGMYSPVKLHTSGPGVVPSAVAAGLASPVAP